MKYQGKEVEVLNTKTVFGRNIAEIKILSSGEITAVPASELSDERRIPSVAEIAFKAIAGKIRGEVFKQSILAPVESNIIPLPHQILALEKVMSAPFIRFLIADEVGMGKTIETGLILKELKLRGIIKRTLIVVPKSAMGQWQQEMKRHFNEQFHVYDTDYINTISRTLARLEGDNQINMFAQHNQIIVSMDALKPIDTRQGWSKKQIDIYNRHRIQNVLEAEFDLLVIDECHKVGGSSSVIGRFQMADVLCNAVPNVLLLSATPHRGKSDHFRRVLQLLDADAFAGEGMPPIADLNPFVVRTEKRQAIDYDGKPLFKKRYTSKIDVRYNDERHARQKALYEAVTRYVVDGFNLAQQTKNNSYGFVMLLFQRMMSSSTQAILLAMQKRAERLANARDDISKENIINNYDDYGFEGNIDFDNEQMLFSLVEEAKVNYDTELTILQGLIRDAKNCLEQETDAKVEILLEKLSELKKSEQKPELKFLIFTEFTGTQYMLKKVLQEKGGYICSIINGSMEFDQRVEALRSFKESSQILICTDAAGESLNMQFAHIVFNYDMPWNPMIIEQRIGRVDRIGQEYEVQAFNMMLETSIDKRVYEVIETKLSQIMLELGIDKTSDVLDSTIETEQLKRLYLTSLLNPSLFDNESSNWLDQIKAKLKQYKSTEGALPRLDSEQIRADKVDAIRHSPLPAWLESLTRQYLRSRSVEFHTVTDGIKFRFPGYRENIYTFNIRESLGNPIPEPVSLQHEIIQTILRDAVPFTPSQQIPVCKIKQANASPGFWSLWHLEVKNQFETAQIIHPVFISSEGENFAAFAQSFWDKLFHAEELLDAVSLIPESESAEIYKTLSQRAEELLMGKYQDFEASIQTITTTIKANKEKSFDFQLKQLNRIGIENIKQSRMKRFLLEKTQWDETFESARQIVPSLRCLLLIKVVHE